MKLRMEYKRFIVWIYLFLVYITSAAEDTANDEYRLLQDLFERKDGNYNPRVRPVANMTDNIRVGFEMALIMLINLDERNQIMKTNVWLRFYWCDHELRWATTDYNGVNVFRIQPDRVWKPDVVLLNNADGRFEVSFKANVLVYNNGWVTWIPCTIYKSSCSIDVTYFPFDEQECELRFGSWTYNADEVSMIWYNFKPIFTEIDLSNYEPNPTWDLVASPGFMNTTFYEDDGISKQYVTYKVRWRRKTLFYTVNLIIPCFLVNCLSIAIFFLPSDCGEKATLGISILLALVVYLQVLVVNLLPPSSNSFPLFARYLLFTILIDGIAVVKTLFILNWNFKTPRTHRMPRLVRKIFFGKLPQILCMERPQETPNHSREVLSPAQDSPQRAGGGSRRGANPQVFNLSDVHHPDCPHASHNIKHRSKRKRSKKGEAGAEEEGEQGGTGLVEPEVNKAVEAVRFISAHLKNEGDYEEVIDDWRYIAQQIDRILLILYFIVTTICTLSILLNAPQIFEKSFNAIEYRDMKKQQYNETSFQNALANEQMLCPWDPKPESTTTIIT